MLFRSNDTGTGGGSISHFTFNAGFTSTLYILNPATTPASFSLNFYDDTGAPLSVPLFLPQTGINVTTDSLVQAMAPGTVLVVQTRANDKLASVSASAQLVSGGTVTAFEVFEWTTTGQEASVPLETRNAGGFVLLYDNTGSRTTGVAVAAFGSGPATIPVVVRDDAGNVVRNDTITLPAHGHTAFLLPSTYPETARKRGMVEFIINPGVKASVIGLQAKSDGSLTTVPALTR